MTGPDRSVLAGHSRGEGNVVVETEQERRAPEAGSVQPVSHGQRALWFLHQLAPESAAYNIAFALRLRSRSDARAIRAAFQAILDRHDILRSTFHERDGGPIRLVAARQDLAWEEVAVAGMDLDAIRERIVVDSRRPFDLTTGPLFRVSLYTRAEDDRILLLTVHHSVFDARSLAIAFDEFVALYPAFLHGTAPRLPPATPYSDFARWQADLVDGPEGERLARYWLERLAGDLPVLELPTDRPRPSVQTLRGGTVEVHLPAALTTSVAALARAERVTPFVVYLSALQVVLQRYSGQSEILVGTPTWGRTRPEFQRGIGYYVNTVVLRGDLSGSPTFRTLLGRSRTTVLEALAHQDYPFNVLVQRLGLAADRSRPPVFQVMFNYLNVSPLMVGGGLAEDGAPTLEVAGLKVEGFPIPNQEGQFDLALEIIQAGSLTLAVIRYNTDLFDRETIERMAGHYRTLLEAAVQDPTTPISHLPILTPEERRRVLVDWNRTERSYPADATLPWLFETQAQRTPDAVAVVCGEDTLTYAELERRANRLAHRLRSCGVGRESLVAIYMERSIEQVVAVLAVTKAGGAWVPIDPDYPPERVRWMLEDSRAPVVLVHAATAGALPSTAAELVRIAVDSTTPGEPFGAASDPAFDSPPARETAPDDLAYVIYTSGTTGRPKGVMNTHRGICNRLLGQNDDLRITPADVCLHASPFGFDVSVTRMFAPLVAGARLVLAPQGAERDARHVVDLIERHAVTVFPLVPSMLHALVETGELERCRTLRCVTCGGEALSPELMRAFLEQVPCELYNAYGPTETAVTVTSWRCDPAWDGAGPVPIGRPMANTRAYVLDAQLEPVPIGVPGELCIGGVQVGRGYLYQPALTAERFVADPFATEPGARLYRTGDRARWLPDGTLEFLGRIDQQVKVRGYRIEPAEIESVLASLPGVSAAVVLPVAADGSLATSGVADALIAFVVPTSTSEGVRTDELRRALQARLPRFMLPARIVAVEHIPLTPNGKVDRKALLTLDPGAAASASAPKAHEAPSTPDQELLAGIFAEVLGLEHVGIHDDFFELGGHSLLATQVVSRIRNAFGLELPVRSLFEAPTVAGLARHLAELRRERDASAAEEPPIVPVPRDQAELPLSFSQQRLWFLYRLEPESTAYNISGAVRLRGTLDTDALERSFSEVVRRHESLRTTFHEIDGRPVQRIHAPTPFALPVTDLSGLPSEEREAEARRRAAEEAGRPFDLEQGPLFRAALLRLAEDEHVLLLGMHHIVSDGWSFGVLTRELGTLYRAFTSGEPSPLEDFEVQYADFAAWQRGWLQGRTLQRQIDYWVRQLDGLATLQLPTDRPRPPVQTYNGDAVALSLPTELARALGRLSRQESASLFMTLLAAFKVLLARYSAQDDIVVGSPIAGRNRAEIEHLIGFFLNSLVLRTDLSGEPSFRELLARVRNVTLDAYANQDVPFERLIEQLDPPRDPSRTPLFQVMFNMLPDWQRSAVPLADLSAEPLAAGRVEAKFDLTVFAAEQPDGTLALRFVYNTDLFDRETIERMAVHYRTLLEAAVQDPATPISRLPILTPEERQAAVSAARRVDIPAPAGAPSVEFPAEALARSIPERFREVVERAPDAVAVETARARWTYEELQQRANQVAHALLGQSGSDNQRIALFCEHDAPMLAAILGSLTAGKTYVPLDPAYPEERLRLLIEDAEPQAILTDRPASELSDWAGELPVLELSHVFATEPTHAPELALDPAAPAYILYTSGSTGRPKGVVQSQRNVLHHIRTYASRLRITPHDRLSLLAAYGFDAAVMDIFGALLSGATLYPIDLRGEDANELPRLIERHGITVLHSTPTVFRHLTSQLTGAENLSAVRLVVLGGEAATRHDLELFRRHFGPGARLINGYGPTECTLALQHVFDHTSELPRTTSGGLPIGRAVDGVQVLLLDHAGEPVETLTPGEIVLRSPYVALGYWKQPDLTAQQFVADSSATEPGARLYRTGDRARWLPDGTLEFLGRIDQQVKVRGYRIEPAEIESVLASLGGVSAAVVLPVAADGSLATSGVADALVAFVVPTGPEGVQTDELREALRARLPRFMLPARIVTVEHIPLTPNGKVDRKALLTLDTGPAAAAAPEAAALQLPETPEQELLAGIFAEVLGLEQVGIHDDFFELGGHSLLATQVVSRIRSAFRLELPVRSLFEAPTVAGLARHLAELRRQHEAEEEPEPPIVPVPRDQAELPLSFSQQRLWFLHRLEPESTAYNISGAVRLRGALDTGALERSFSEVVRRHESLRTTFHEIDGRPVLRIHAPTPFTLPVTDLSGLSPEEREAEVRRRAAEEASRPFDLEQGPLFRAELLRLADDEHVLLLGMHHIVSDGWSFGVLTRELGTLYRAFASGEPSPLAELPIQYADFAVWQRSWLQGRTLEGSVLQRQLDYWTRQLDGLATLQLPTDRPRPPVQTYNGDAVALSLPTELARALGRLARQESASLFMMLLAAFKVLLARYAAQDDIVVGSPIAGRNRAEIEHLIGFFLNSLVLRTDLSGEPSFRELLARVRNVTLDAYAHQDVPFEKLVEHIDPPRDPSRTPLFQVMFNMLPDWQRSVTALADLTAEPLAAGRVQAKFDLTVFAAEQPDGTLALRFVYNTDLFERATIERMAGHYRTLLEAVVEDPARSISRLPILTPEERQAAERAAAARVQIPEPAGASAADFPAEALARSIPERFREVVERAPDAVAVETARARWTYEELQQRANQVAHALLRETGSDNQRVALFLEHDAPMLAAILGTLTAGKTYVPLDPAYPEERLRLLLEDAEPQAILTDRPASELSDWAGELPVLELSHIFAAEPEHAPELTVDPATPAYILYTSGSTGRPKGVVQSQRNVLHHIRTYASRLRITPHDRLSLLAAYGFDAAVMDIFGALLSGATLYPIDLRGEDAGRLSALVERHGITVLHSTPTVFRHLTSQLTGAENLSAVRLVVLGGEAATRHDLELFRRHFGPHARLINGYGPTECTLALQHVFDHTGEPPRTTAGGLPIGRAVDGLEVLLLNEAGEPVETLAPGEIVLRSPYVALGYWRSPELTAERFVADPSATEPGVRLYHTGDRARWLPDGTLEFLGRIDQQVKVRGYRIEPGEIESILASENGISAAVVVPVTAEGSLATSGTAEALIAFVVPENGTTGLDTGELRKALQARLPRFMLPARIVTVDHIPLTPNGKVDRRALLKLDTKPAAAPQSFNAPRTETEMAIAAIWRELLEVDVVDLDDNFYDLGGHSMLALQVVSRVEKAIGVRINPRELNFQTVRQLAATCDARRTTADGGRSNLAARVLRGLGLLRR